MGSKKKTKTKNVYTVTNKIVKLSYLQTLAVNDGYTSTDELKTKPYSTGKKKVFSDSDTEFNPIKNPITGFAKKKSSGTKQTWFGATQVKENWLQPYYDYRS